MLHFEVEPTGFFKQHQIELGDFMHSDSPVRESCNISVQFRVYNHNSLSVFSKPNQTTINNTILEKDTFVLFQIEDLAAIIFTFLPIEFVISKLSLVSKSFYQIIHSNVILWKSFVSNYFCVLPGQ